MQVFLKLLMSTYFELEIWSIPLGLMGFPSTDICSFDLHDSIYQYK